MASDTEPGEHLIYRGLEILEMLYNFGTDIVDYDEKLYKSMRMISDGLKDIEERNLRVWCNE